MLAQSDIEYVPIHTREQHRFPLPDDYPSFLTNEHWWCWGRRIWGVGNYLRPSVLFVGDDLVGYTVGLYCKHGFLRKTLPHRNPSPLTWEECLQRCEDLVEWCGGLIVEVSTQIERMEWLARGEKIVGGEQ